MSANKSSGALLQAADVAKHSSKSDCWVIIHGAAFDVTEFMPEHPGGPSIILKYAGKDATKAYDPIHPPGTIEQYLPKDKHKGAVDMTGVKVENMELSPADKERQDLLQYKPPLDECLSLHDFETVASKTMTQAAWAYYSSGSDDEITMRENHIAYQRLWFRPRVLRDVTNIDFSCTMLGTKTSIPIYITATALGKLGHPDGEKNLTWAAAKHDVIQMIPTLASCSFDEIRGAAVSGQTQWLQLYVNKDRAITKKIVQHAEETGIKGLFVTVDAPCLGRRIKDMRQKFADAGSDVQAGDSSVDKSQGAARAISSFIDTALTWKDIDWLKSITKMPVILKGVQCTEDAVLAYERGAAGVVLSNHGGRQLDQALSGIEILVEVMEEFKRRKFDTNKFEIYIDGGVRRASDVLKAVALGAKGVGIGRPFLYAYSAYGHEGVSRALQILKDEMEMNMRLIGAPSLSDLRPEMVDTSAIKQRSLAATDDRMFLSNYEMLRTASMGSAPPPKSRL